jgi:multidrug efflux system membrane fusion protein
MSRKLLYLSMPLALLVAISGCKKGGASAATGAMARPAPAVTAAQAVTRDVPVYLDAIGKTVSPQVVTVIPQVGGKIVETSVVDGAYVNKGDVLFKIDSRPYDAALASAKATLKQNQSELLLAQAEMRRVEELAPSNIISPLEYDQKKSALGVADAKIEAANAAIEMAKLDVEYCTIRAPMDGRAGVRWIDVGNVVKENEGTMLIIQQLDPIYAEFTVTENDLGTVRKFLASRGMRTGDESDRGLVVQVDVPGDSARVLTALGQGSAATQPATRSAAGPRSGTLIFLDNTVQTTTGTVKLRAKLPNSDRYFWPGQFVNCRLELMTKKDAVLVPVAAQQIGQQGPYVYVVAQGEVDDPQSPGHKKPATVAQIRPITPGQRQGDLLVVENGLSAGEKVIVTGQMMVMPGGAVSVTNDAPVAQTAMGSR